MPFLFPVDIDTVRQLRQGLTRSPSLDRSFGRGIPGSAPEPESFGPGAEDDDRDARHAARLIEPVGQKLDGLLVLQRRILLMRPATACRVA